MARWCFCHTDADGFCSGAIVYWWAESKTDVPYQETIIYPINYSDSFPLEKIKPGDAVYIVDFSIPPDVMDKLLDITPNVVWIDHHKTAIDKYAGFARLDKIQGIRSNDEAGCVLTWGFIHPGTVVPTPVLLIGDRDVWRYAYGDETRNFCMGLQMRPTGPKEKIWRQLFDDSGKSMVFEIQKEGAVALRFRDSWASGYAKAWSYEAMFEGIKCCVMNLGRCGSEYFGDRIKQYDICASVIHNGEQWFVSLYSETIDVSGLAQKYGGGGHRGASGFNAKELPFKKITS